MTSYQGIRVATALDDPRLYEIDGEFRQIFTDIASLAIASRIQKSRFFHRSGTTARGVLRLHDDLDLPANGFFRPGGAFDVVARYSNGMESDDLAPAIRGLTLRFLAPGAGIQDGLLDLPLSSGECFFASTAAIFRQSGGTDEDKAALVDGIPHFRDTVWGSYRTATSFAEYHYHSQSPRCLVDDDGQVWFVRYRLVPSDGTPDRGQFSPGELWLPPDPPHELTRPDGATGSRTYLHDELRTRVQRGPIGGTLQIQIRPVTGDAAADEAALDASLPWNQPWRDVATVRLDTLVDNAEVENVRFNPNFGPAELGIAIATSPHEHASLNHLRTLLYQLTSAARTGAPLPEGLAALLPDDKVAAIAPPAAAGCPFSGQAVEEPRSRTVAVVGAGPAGLSIARELEKAGHRAVVLEALPTVGGKCESVDIDDHAYDMGGHVCTTQYENVAELAVELGVTTEDTTQHRVYDIASGVASPQSTAFFQREPFSRYAALRAAEFPKIAEAGLAHSAQALAKPVSEWLAEHQLESLAESLGTGYTAAGYGYLAGDLPALYFVKYAEMTGLLSSKPELLGHTHSFTIVGGFMSLWEKVAAELSDVRCGVTITAIDRDPDAETGGVTIETLQGDVIADDLVITVPVDQLMGVLDATREERDLASRVRVMDYYTTVVSATGLPEEAFYLVDEFTQPEAPVGDAVSFHHRYPGEDVYACYSYGDDSLTGEDVTDHLRANVERMGGQMGEVHTQRRWKFLPHFGSDDLAGGIYDRIEQLQGENHTYHAGSLPAYELVECNVAYARALVRQHFGGASDDDVEGHAVAVAEAPERPRPSVDTLREWLVEHIAAELRVPTSQVTPDARLDTFALESLSVAALQSGLSDWLGFRIPHTLFFEQPTIEAIATNLGAAAEEKPETPNSSTLLLGLTGARPFFCIGGALGAAYYLLPLARDVGAARPFYGVRAPGYDGLEEPLDTVEALAARYIESIRSVQPYGPYLVGGHSFGGVVAYEVGRQLRKAGEEVSKVVLLDAYVPVPGQNLPPVDDIAAIGELLTMNRLAFKSGGPAGVEIDPDLSPSEQKKRLGRFLGANGSGDVEDHIDNMLRVYQANIEANVKYQPGPSDLRVSLLKATGGFPPVMAPHRAVELRLGDAANGWEHVDLGELTVEEIPGDHFTMFVEPNDEVLASAVFRCLAEDDRRGANTTAARGTGAETAVAFNPKDPGFLNDPYPFYRSLRETSPIHYEDTVGGWVLTRYDDVSAVLRDQRVIRPPVGDYLFASVPQSQREEMADFERLMSLAIPFTNAPYHTRLRSLVSKAFTPRMVKAMRPRVQEITDGLLDAIEAKGGGDLMSEVAYPLPSSVVMEFIGVPSQDHRTITGWATDIMAMLGAQFAEDAPGITRRASHAMDQFTAYMTDLIAERSKDPRDDLLSTLISVTGPDGRLTNEELVLNCMAMLNAGTETTANYLGNGTLALMRRPEQARLLRENPSYAENAAEELLRFDGPAPIMTPQLADADLEVGGQLIRKGQLVFPVVGAANRDPARFDDPERLDVSRAPNGQLSFGFGIHFCIGAALARIEGQVFFPTLLRRFPDLRLDPTKPAPAFRDDPLLRGLSALDVRV